MLVYQTDYTGDGRFVGAVQADPDPMEEGQFLIPAGAVEVAPPEVEEPAYPRWTGKKWEVFTPPVPEPEPEPEPNLTKEVDSERDRRMTEPFLFAGKLFDGDREAQGRIEKARTSAAIAIIAGAQAGDFDWPGMGIPFAWFAHDNSPVPMDAQTVARFGGFLAAREGILITIARSIKNRILAGETIPDVTEDSLWQLPT